MPSTCSKNHKAVHREWRLRTPYKQQPIAPERKLWAAVIEQAVRDVTGQSSPIRAKHEDVQTAKAFLFDSPLDSHEGDLRERILDLIGIPGDMFSRKLSQIGG